MTSNRSKHFLQYVAVYPILDRTMTLFHQSLKTIKYVIHIGIYAK